MNEPIPTVVRLRMSGEFDISNKDDLSQMLLRGEWASRVIIDMTGTTYIDSSALRCLVQLRQKLMERSGGAVELVGVHSTVRRLFTVTGLQELFEISNGPEVLER